ncbi:tetratricopeptide repeat-containing protein [uncultured Roseovarius sp.]|uniref:tetratricopeptide repeat-containing protein n=1 Tax=uncultured Roseovarius sp. TaxID=293344 RepID=UPI002602DF63|nr:tetratricopeptide repeat-containing protein [uncultured Roseovarius sp.]
MSYMTMTMFAPRIWGFDLNSPQARVARQAGWSRADILWEGLMEKANAAWVDGARPRAGQLFRRASWVTRLCFARDDLRRATVLANLGIMARATGQGPRAAACFAKAAAQWDACAEVSVAEMQIAPRARSSLFHLRMEARHRDTYHDNMRLRLGKIAAEMRAALEAMAKGEKPGCRLYARWRGERPNVYDDTRKVLGACLLIIDAEPDQA